MLTEEKREWPEKAEPKVSLAEKLRASVLALLLVNLAPLLGVWVLDWSIGMIMIFYWSENLVIGFFNVLKMRRAQGAFDSTRYRLNDKPVQPSDRRALITFFIIHYGFFTFGHGVFVWVLFGGNLGGALDEIPPALLLLFISHGISYRRNFIGHGEYHRVSFPQLFWQPYRRVIIMHLTILLGGALAQAQGSPIWALVVMVVLKSILDLFSHLGERRSFRLIKT